MNDEIEDTGGIDSKRLNAFSKNVYNASKLEATNNKNFSLYYQYVFDSCLTSQDKELLKDKGKNTFNFSTLRPFILHGLKGVKDSTPTVSFRSVQESAESETPDMPAEMVAAQLSEKLNEIFSFSHFTDIVYKCAQDQYIGGKGILKIRTDYLNDYDFEQTFFIEHVLNPTSIYKDPRSREPTGADAEWCAEKISMNKEEFKRSFPDIEWREIERAGLRGSSDSESAFTWVESAKSNTKEQIVNILDYYYYEYEEKTISQGDEMRTVQRRKVWRVRYVGAFLLKEPEETVFESLPFVWISAESYLNKDGEVTLVPYAKHGFDAMRAKNFTLNYYMSAVLNQAPPTYRVAEDMFTDNLADAMRNKQSGKIQVYPNTVKDAQSQEQSLPLIQDVPSPPLPQELLEAAGELDKNLPAIFGTQFPSLDDLNNVSGKALYNLAQYMSASTEVLMQNLLKAIVQVGTVIKEGMPAILRSEQVQFEDTQANETRQVMFDYIFTPSKYQVVGHRGVSTQLQKEANFENLMGLSKEIPTFAQFLQTPEVMSQLLEMLDLQDEPKWMKLWENYQAQQQQAQAASSNQPSMEELAQTKAHADLLTAQSKNTDAQTRAQALPEEMERARESQRIELAKLGETRRRTSLRGQIDVAKLNQKHTNDLLNHEEKRYESL